MTDPGRELTAPRRDSIARRLAVLVGLFAAVQVVIHARTLLDTLGADPVWGPVYGLTLILLVITVAATRLLPVRTLRRLWIGVAVVGLALRWVWEFTGHALDEQPWIYSMQPTFAAYAALAWPFVTSVVYAVLTIALPPLLTVVGLAGVAPTVVADSPRQLLNVVVVVGLDILRRRLTAGAMSSQAASEAAAVAAQTEAALAERERTVALIHDEIVAVLLSVAHDPVGDRVRVEAAAAIEVIVAELANQAAEESVDLAAGVRSVVADLVPQADVVLPDTSLVVPAAVGQALLGATREALRNVIRHAGPAAVRITVSSVGPGGLTIEIADDGVGFDPDRVERGRLGLQHGVHGRVQALLSGQTVVVSAPGEGTVVTLRWTP